MAEIRQLARPPITEALVDIRVSLPAAFRAEELKNARGALSDRYPHFEEMRRFEALFEMKAGVPVAARQSDRGLIGYRFKSTDGRNVAQFRLDGFTYNRLEPYTSWSEIRPEAMRLWSVYEGHARPGVIERVALRYINRLVVPPAGNLTDFLAVGPPQVPGAPRYLASFLMRLTSQEPETATGANIAQSLEPGTSAGPPVLILDIDVFRSPTGGLTSGEIGPVLDQLRRSKNEIFFGIITESAARSFE